MLGPEARGTQIFKSPGTGLPAMIAGAPFPASYSPTRVPKQDNDNHCGLSVIQFAAQLMLDDGRHSGKDMPAEYSRPPMDIFWSQQPRKRLPTTLPTEIWGDRIADTLRELGITNTAEGDVHRTDTYCLCEWLRLQRRRAGVSWIDRAHIRRSDWARTSGCIYGVSSETVKGSDEDLHAHRPNVKQGNIRVCIKFGGQHHWYHVVMCPYLPIDNWLDLWRGRRVGRSA